MDKTSLDSNGTPLHQDPPTPRAAPTAAERVAAAEAIVAEMVADPEWQDKLSTYGGEVTFNAQAVREFSRRYNAKLGTNLELSEGVVGGGIFIAPEETPESRANKALWLATAEETELPRPDSAWKVPTEANWLVDDLDSASPQMSFEFTYPADSTVTSTTSRPLQTDHEPTGTDGEVTPSYSADLLAGVWSDRTVRHCIVETLEIDRGDGSPLVTIGCDPGHGTLLPFYNADLGHVFAAPCSDFDPGHAVLPSDVRKILARNGLDRIRSEAKVSFDKLKSRLKAQSDLYQQHEEPILASVLNGQLREIKLGDAPAIEFGVSDELKSQIGITGEPMTEVPGNTVSGDKPKPAQIQDNVKPRRFLDGVETTTLHEPSMPTLEDWKRQLKRLQGGIKSGDFAIIRSPFDPETIAIEYEASYLGKSPFQDKCARWAQDVLGEASVNDKAERALRFLEEALELVQAAGLTADQVAAMSDYVYGRPQGEILQEVGGVGVTLALLCDVHGVEMDRAFEIEITRVSDPEIKAKVRAKQEAKPNDICGDYKDQSDA